MSGKNEETKTCPKCGSEIKRVDHSIDSKCPVGWAYLACTKCDWRGPVPRESLPYETRVYGFGGGINHDHGGGFGYSSHGSGH